MNKYPQPGDDVIDSRDVTKAIADLELLAGAGDALSDDDLSLLSNLRELAEDVEGRSSAWLGGTALISYDYFEDYARELAEDTGEIGPYDAWPVSCIDWTKAARELEVDYASAEFGGVLYLFR